MVWQPSVRSCIIRSMLPRNCLVRKRICQNRCAAERTNTKCVRNRTRKSQQRRGGGGEARAKGVGIMCSSIVTVQSDTISLSHPSSSSSFCRTDRQTEPGRWHRAHNKRFENGLKRKCTASERASEFRVDLCAYNDWTNEQRQRMIRPCVHVCIEICRIQVSMPYVR